MKNRVVSQYLFQRHIKSLILAYIYAIVILIVMPLMFAIISGSFGTFSIGNTFKGIDTGLITTFILGGMALLSYEDYKFLIQNSISRNTFFKNQVSSFGFIILIGAMFDELYSLITRFFLGGTTLYQSWYGNFITNATLSELMGFLYHILWLLAVVATGLAVGSFLSLFSKKVQRLIIIGSFVAFVVLLGIIFSASNRNTIAVTWIADFAKFILGYQGQEIVTPIFLMLFYVIWSVIMVLISRIFYNRKQIKRV
ncbi:hypothetical protein OXT66_07015 [Lentilactobacillus senioris]|uniref:hypothetical protein n=1 Tax=Lentilactobacillus senioris TaxID=931534 RepID=UPI00228059C7|nr:hypothetical protein [Lentilactobacillus senioris]MCY9807282.1 hypothetical protein [Lentilactobacillus senioris]